MIVTKKRCITALFYFAYFTFLLFSMFGHLPTVGGYLKELTNAGIAIFAIIILLRLQDYSVREGIVLVLFLAYGLFIAYTTGDYGFFKLAMMIFAGKGLNFRSIIRKDLATRVILTGVMFCLFVNGKAPDFTSIYDGVVRHSMGFQNPNHVGIIAFIVIMEIIYLSGMKLTPLHYVAIFTILVMESKVSGSRTAELIALLAILLATIFSFKSGFFEKTGVKRAMRCGGFMCAILTAIAFFLYRTGNRLVVDFDRIISYRILLVFMNYNKLGITLFGNDISNIERSLDNLYGFLCIGLGIVSFLLVMIAYYKLERRLCNFNKPLAIIMFCFFVYGLSERLWFYIDYNVFMLAFAELIYPYYTNC